MTQQRELLILTGPIQSGKSTALQAWAKTRNVGGIISPIVNGCRVFYTPALDEHFDFEASKVTDETISVGQYHFYKEAFHRANTIIENSMNCDWLIIDEIGPLELKGEGLCRALTKVLTTSSPSVVFVVRDTLIEKVVDHFNLQNVKCIGVREFTDILK
jgi:nucleoside-triphosphatase THEP1